MNANLFVSLLCAAWTKTGRLHETDALVLEKIRNTIGYILHMIAWLNKDLALATSKAQGVGSIPAGGPTAPG